ncbi:hypothetical protein EPN52_01745 [bacterium]|nr:MAG: hypothetical protein EPN52_01745 [bacterium]
MLAQVLVPLLGLALLVAALATGTIATAHASVARTASSIAAGALEHAQQQLIDAIASAVRAGGGVTPVPLPAPSTGLVSYAANLWRVETSVAQTGASGTQGGVLVAPSLQQSPGVAEGRIAARVTAVVRGADGTPLATRARMLTLRVLAAPPYAVVTGVLDAAALSIDEQGDSGGASAGDDTRVHAVLLCADGGSGACNGATPRPADRFADQSWDAGTQPPQGWAR